MRKLKQGRLVPLLVRLVLGQGRLVPRQVPPPVPGRLVPRQVRPLLVRALLAWARVLVRLLPPGLLPPPLSLLLSQTTDQHQQPNKRSDPARLINRCVVPTLIDCGNRTWPTLTLAISVLGSRVFAIEPPPPLPGVSILILVQDPPFGARGLFSGRADIALELLPGRGLSKSRNAALARAKTDYLLFWDDDLRAEPSGLRAMVQAMAGQPELDFATGRRRGRGPGGYPVLPQPLTLWNSGKTASPELMLRPARFRQAGLAFDTDFGLGARWPVGEEYVLIADALRAGLRGQFFPIDLGAHGHASTGDNWSDQRILVARQAVLRRVFGVWSPFIRLAYAWCHRQRLGRRFWRFIFTTGTY